MNAPRLLGWLILLLLLTLPHAARANSTAVDQIHITVLGDSLTAGYGLPAAEAFPVQLQQALAQAGLPLRVSNAGVSGDTTAGGLARLDWMLTDRPDLVIVELGANDALRGLDPEQTRANLAAIIQRLQAAGVRVLLAGMRAPRNLGPEYYNNFDRLYTDLAQQYQVPLYEFFLDGVAGQPELNQADGLHPTAQGVAVIVERILPLVKQSIDQF